MDNKNYYEFFNWENVTDLSHNSFSLVIKSFIPKEINEIIDIGCGNGVIANELSSHFPRVVGVDRSEKALSFVKTEKILASCDDIPVPDRSFDLVMSTELLEHLEDDVFLRTIGEMKRISRKYILITVPHDENIRKLLIQCPSCGYRYNRSYHLRKFSRNDLEGYFKEFKTLEYKVFGKKVRGYNARLSNLKHSLTPPSAWIPFFWTPNDKRNSMCPNCEHIFNYKYRFNLPALLFDLLNILASAKKPYWQLLLLERLPGKKES